MTKKELYDIEWEIRSTICAFYEDNLHEYNEEDRNKEIKMLQRLVLFALEHIDKEDAK